MPYAFNFCLPASVIQPVVYAGDDFGSSVFIDGNTKRFLIGASGYSVSTGKIMFGKVN
jgi:hypothetical protein